MPNLFANIPVPAGNGSGAPVDVSTFGYYKTVSVAGSFTATVTIEISNELAPTRWAPVAGFGNADGANVECAARWMRATVTGYVSGAPTCDLGGTDEGASFASLPTTAGNGTGAAIAVSSLPLLKTITVGGPFRGYVQVEVSEDGLTRWSQVGFGFSNPGLESQQIVARYMRVVRSGVPQIDPGLPIVNVGACAISAGGGGGASIVVDNQGVALPNNPFTTLDFTGGGVVAADAGAGVATITIPGTVTTDGTTITGDGSTGSPLAVVGGGSASPNPLYGLGIDGALVFDGVATVAGLVPVGGVYAMTRDLYATTLTVTAAARLKTTGSAVFATVSVTVDGVLDDDGNPGTLGINGAERGLRRFGFGTSPTGSGGSSFTWPVLFPTAPSIAGGAAGVAGGNGTSPGQGAGGGGGLGPGDPGGPLAQASGPSNVGATDFLTLLSGRQLGDRQVAQYGSGGGLGGGGIGSPGGGGCGGGALAVCAPLITGTGRISARGGGGFAGTTDCGGGGGGGGGMVLLAYNSIGAVTVDVAGGVGGAGNGAGAAGGTGAAGVVLVCPQG